MLTGKLGKADETQNDGLMFPWLYFANREYPENNKN